VSLSDDPTFAMLKHDFVCGFRDITGEPWCGVSGQYDADDGAVWTTNGAGPHNIQMFVLAADGTVLHCLPGYWESHDLADELGFAQKVGKVWQNTSFSREQKDARFAAMNLEHVKQHSQETVARSEMQGFDKKFEARRAARSDCILRPGMPAPRYRPRKDDEFKTTDQIVHERMAARPFVPYAQFDVERFTDYGRQKYDQKQALLADLLPKAGPGGLRAKLAALLHREPKPAPAEGAADDRSSERRTEKKALLQQAQHAKETPPDPSHRTGG
jgi:hypothetical protein